MGIAIGARLVVLVRMVGFFVVKKAASGTRTFVLSLTERRLEKARIQEQKRAAISKPNWRYVPSILYLAKEAERNNIKEALYWYDKAAHLDNVTGKYVRHCTLSMKRKKTYFLREKRCTSMQLSRSQL